MEPRISVIIVNYNTAELLRSCLASLLEQNSLIREIIVVDNASVDLSAALVREEFPSVHLMAQQDNIGFGRANNLAFGMCSGELLFLLNPDTCVLPGCLAAIQNYMLQNKEIGMAGTATHDADMSFHPTVQYEYPGDHYAGALFSDLPGTIAWLLGASLVLRREVMQHVQGFDPDFFLYGEDIDLCLRIRQAGWPLGYITDARIVHHEGQSERNTEPAKVFEKKMRAELLFFTKHYSSEIVCRIKRARWLQAWWRLATLRLSSLFCKSEIIRMKLTKYSVATRVYR